MMAFFYLINDLKHQKLLESVNLYFFYMLIFIFFYDLIKI
jgi:hypothetical protein